MKKLLASAAFITGAIVAGVIVAGSAQAEPKYNFAVVPKNLNNPFFDQAKLAQKIKPKGGTICIQSGGAAAANHNERMQGIRDTLAGAKSKESPGDRLTGQNGWTEVDGCPLYTNDDFPLSVQQMEDTLGK